MKTKELDTKESLDVSRRTFIIAAASAIPTAAILGNLGIPAQARAGELKNVLKMGGLQAR